jgi:hypothetical protein
MCSFYFETRQKFQEEAGIWYRSTKSKENLIQKEEKSVPPPPFSAHITSDATGPPNPEDFPKIIYIYIYICVCFEYMSTIPF